MRIHDSICCITLLIDRQDVVLVLYVGIISHSLSLSSFSFHSLTTSILSFPLTSLHVHKPLDLTEQLGLM